MKRFLMFFIKGQGLVLTLVLAALGVCWVIGRTRTKQEARKQTTEVKRDVGTVNPQPSVDKAVAPKEVVLDNRTLVPGQKSNPEIITVNNEVQAHKSLPTLVSFYSASVPSPTPTPEPKQPDVPQIWLPPTIFIPCQLLNTVDSSHMNTPVVAEVIRDVIENGNLIFPAGTLVSSFAQTATRDRIEVAGNWLFVFKDGRQLKLNGIACVRQADPTNQQFGPEDGSAGILGTIEESDHWANAKALLPVIVKEVTNTVTGAASIYTRGAIQGGDTQSALDKYWDQLLEGKGGDARYVHCIASTEFYIFPTDTAFPTHRSIDNKASDQEQKPFPIDPMQSAFQMERQLKQENQPQQDQDANKPHYKF